MTQAFRDPIAEIKREYGLVDDILLNEKDEELLCGPYSQVSLLLTDPNKNKWVNTDIKGSTSIVLLKDVGAPISVIRIEQESASGDVGKVIFEYELPLNFKMEKITSNLTAISCMNTKQYMGIYFSNSVADCSMFNMKITELNEVLEAD